MTKKTIFLVLLLIFATKFFDSVAVANNGILKFMCFGYVSIAILISLPHFLKYKRGFVFPVQLMCIALLISVIMAQFTWNQGIKYMPTAIPYMIWFVFFYLLTLNVSITVIEKIVICFGIIYIVLFLYQFTHTDVVLFGMADEFKEDRGVIRVNFPGAGVFFLSCFISINKVTSAVKYRYAWLIFSLFCVLIIALQVTRQSIVIILLMYLIHFLRNVKLPYKVAVLLIFGFTSYLLFNSDNPITQGLKEQQKIDASAGKDYIRIKAANYYLTQFTPNTISKIFGNGIPNNTSRYGQSLTYLENNYGYFLTDVGVVDVYITTGILAIVAYIIIFIKSFTIGLPSKYYYLKYYLWTIGATCFTSDMLVSYGFLITTVLVLYCYQRIIDDNLILEDYFIELKDIKTHSSDLLNLQQ